MVFGDPESSTVPEDLINRNFSFSFLMVNLSEFYPGWFLQGVKSALHRYRKKTAVHFPCPGTLSFSRKHSEHAGPRPCIVQMMGAG